MTIRIRFKKYQALGNDFILLEKLTGRLTKRQLPRLALTICDRRNGVGADGVLWLSESKKADCKLDIYNADGSWAEKSGNGLRITAAHLGSTRRRREFKIETATSIDTAKILRKLTSGYNIMTELGCPELVAKNIPVRTRKRFLINSPIRIGKVDLPVTCVGVGNPNTVLLVNDFDFDWQSLGADIEIARAFPNRTNVEFVQVVNSKKIKVVQWERGAGATASSGTGAAASVCAMVLLGLVQRQCEVISESGSVKINWRATDDIIELTGPAAPVMEGTFDYQ